MRRLLLGAYLRAGVAEGPARRAAGGFRDHYLDPAHWSVFPDSAAALDRLSAAGYQHMIVSNHVPELRQLVSALGLADHFDEVLTSASVGFEKPHPGDLPVRAGAGRVAVDRAHGRRQSHRRRPGRASGRVTGDPGPWTERARSGRRRDRDPRRPISGLRLSHTPRTVATSKGRPGERRGALAHPSPPPYSGSVGASTGACSCRESVVARDDVKHQPRPPRKASTGVGQRRPLWTVETFLYGFKSGPSGPRLPGADARLGLGGHGARRPRRRAVAVGRRTDAPPPWPIAPQARSPRYATLTRRDLNTLSSRPNSTARSSKLIPAAKPTTRRASSASVTARTPERVPREPAQPAPPPHRAQRPRTSSGATFINRDSTALG